MSTERDRMCGQSPQLDPLVEAKKRLAALAGQLRTNGLSELSLAEERILDRELRPAHNCVARYVTGMSKSEFNRNGVFMDKVLIVQIAGNTTSLVLPHSVELEEVLLRARVVRSEVRDYTDGSVVHMLQERQVRIEVASETSVDKSEIMANKDRVEKRQLMEKLKAGLQAVTAQLEE